MLCLIGHKHLYLAHQIMPRTMSTLRNGARMSACTAALSEGGQEGQQGIGGGEAGHWTFKGREFVQRLLFLREIDCQIAMGGLNALVAQPQGNDREIDPCLEQVQSGRMAPMSSTT